MNLTGHFNNGYLPGFRLDPNTLRRVRQHVLLAMRFTRRWLLRPYLLTFLAIALIETVLGLRLWTQLTSQPLDNGWLSPLLSLSDHLVAPFRDFDSNPPLKETGVLDISTLVAMNVYLVLGLAGIATGVLATVCIGAISRCLHPRRGAEELSESRADPGQ
jgi:hypothetical protein